MSFPAVHPALAAFGAPNIGLLIPSSGPAAGGNPVVILGSGLNNASSVTFGGVPAPIVFGDPIGILLIVTAPPGTGTVPVVVTTPSGTSAPAFYTYLPPGPPIVLSIAPNSGPVAGGTPFTITGVGLNGATVKFNGVATPVTVNTLGTTITGVTPAGVAGNVPVLVTTPGGSATVPGGFTYI